jgi:glycosyltransferase involved in cell wall biosynthesis
MSWGAILVAIKGLKANSDIVHIHDPELIWTIPIFKIFKKVVIYDAHEDLPRQLLGKTYLSSGNKGLLEVLVKAALSIARSADLIVCATEKIGQEFPPGKRIVVKNYPVWTDIKSKKRRDGKSKHFIYVGALDESRGITNLVNAASKSNFPSGWDIWLAGPISHEYLKEISSLPGWSKVKFWGQVPPDKARELIASSEIGISLLHPTPAYIDALPTKIFEYFAEGIPVLVSDFQDVEGLEVENTLGIRVDPLSPEAIAHAMNELANAQNRLEMGTTAIAIAKEKFNWSAEFLKLEKHYALFGDTIHSKSHES